MDIQIIELQCFSKKNIKQSFHYQLADKGTFFLKLDKGRLYKKDGCLCKNACTTSIANYYLGEEAYKSTVNTKKY